MMYSVHDLRTLYITYFIHNVQRTYVHDLHPMYMTYLYYIYATSPKMHNAVGYVVVLFQYDIFLFGLVLVASSDFMYDLITFW